MSTRRFSLLALSVIAAVLVAFPVLVGRRTAFEVVHVLSVRGSEGFLWLDDLLEARPWRGTFGPKPGRATAVGFMESSPDRSDTGAQEWVKTYHDLTRETPALRPALAPFLYAAASGALDRSLDVRPLPSSKESAERQLPTLTPALMAELSALEGEEPDNALWRILHLHWQLTEALQLDREAPRVKGQICEPYRLRDSAALDRARDLARKHGDWRRLDWHWKERLRLNAAALRERGASNAYAEFWGTMSVLLPTLSHFRGTARKCTFLGYEALRAGNREEARLWFETVLSLGQAALVEDNCLVQTQVAALILNTGHTAMADWHASGGDFLAAGQHRKAIERIRQFTEAIKPKSESKDMLQQSRERAEPLDIAASMMASAALGAATCGIAWLLAGLSLVLERRQERRAQMRRPDVRWGTSETMWAAAGGVLPWLLVGAGLACVPPALDREFVKSIAVPLAVIVAMATPLLVMGAICRRVWRRLRDAGGAGRSSALWPLLSMAVILTLAVVVMTRRALPFTVLGLPRPAGRLTVADVALLLGLEVAAAGAAALVLAAVARLRRAQPWAERAVRTSWLTRSFAVATVILVVVAVLSGARTIAASRDVLREAARAFEAETQYVVGGPWIGRYFAWPLDDETSQPATQPTSRPASEPN